MPVLTLLAGWALLCHGPLPLAAAPIVVEKNGPATLLVDQPRGQDGVTLKLADLLTVTLEVESPKSLEVKPPAKITNSPGWRLALVSPAVVMDVDKERRRWRQDYTFEPLFPGALSLQIEPVLVRENSAVFREITWKPLAVRAVTSISTPELKDLRDPTVIETLPSLPESRNLPWVWLAGFLLLVCMMALLFFRWRRRSRAAAVPAEQWALRQLERLLALRLPEQEKIERFHTLLANLVRRYVEKKYALPARRRTTPEFLHVLQNSQSLSDSQQHFLRDFLAHCDLAKFARAHTSAKECIDLAEKARGFMAATAQPRGQSSQAK